MDSNQSSSIEVHESKIEVDGFESTDETIVDFFNSLDNTQNKDLQRVLKVGVLSLKAGAGFDPETPLGDLRESMLGEFKDLEKSLFKEFQNKFSSLKQSVDRKIGREQIKEETSLKGYDFEDMVSSKLQEICSITGGGLEDTSETIGFIENCKVGDFVVSLKDGKRITVEAKNRKITEPQLEEQIRKANQNRNSDFCLIVNKDIENLPQKVGFVKRYKNGMSIALETSCESDLETAKKILYFSFYLSMEEVQCEEEEDTVSTGLMISELNEIQKKLRKLTQIKKQATKIKNTADSLWDRADSLKDEMEEDFEALKMNLKEAD